MLWNRASIRAVTLRGMEQPTDDKVCDNTECAVRIGRELRCNTVIVGSVVKFGRLVTISARAVDVNSGGIAADWVAESFTGEEGLWSAVRDLADEVTASGTELPKGEVRPHDTELRADLMFEDFESSFTLGAGLPLRGLESGKRDCHTEDEVTTCFEYTARLDWLAEIGLWARLKDSRWSLGFKAGGASAKTTLAITLRTPSYSDSAYAEDGGFNYYLCPILGYVLYESNAGRIMVAGGVGYRDFSDDSEVDKAFSSSGISIRLFPLRVDLTYWHGFDSESLLKDVVTVNLGVGTGF
jgi:hypothetical protein